MSQRIIILSDVIEYDINLEKDVLDTVTQVEAVYESLISFGYQVFKIKFTPNLIETSRAITEIDPVFVFNLVEDENYIVIAPLLLDNLNIPYTGCSSNLIHITHDKVLFKELFIDYLKSQSILLPGYVTVSNANSFKSGLKYIIKANKFHSSIGINQESVIKPNSIEELQSILRDKKMGTDIDFFAEEYIDGREFNIAILNNEILPIAEMKFENYSNDMEKIVCYSAKWDEKSFEFSHTIRNFDYPDSDKKLIDNLKKITEECIKFFNISGYARIDYRVSKDNMPYILEINTNPCISKDAGFFAACIQKKYSYDDMIQKIIKFRNK